MRNIFDQYEQPENRLTHSLVTALYYDRKLLKKFVRWVSKSAPTAIKSLNIVEQRIPGDTDILDYEGGERGLPDAWVYNDGNDDWSLIIESKIASKLSRNQVVRHYRTAERRGYTNITVLVVDTELPRVRMPEYVKAKTWSDIYQWLIRHRHESEWAGLTIEYFEIAETRFADKGYLKEGTLTIFSGIPFDKKNTYNYPEAKRVLKLAMDELRKRKDLVRELRMDPKNPGRGMITGKGGTEVWDYLGLKVASGKEGFTKYPHITLSIERDRMIAIATIPNAIHTQYRRNLIDLGEDGFFELMYKITMRLQRVLRKEKWACPIISSVQRRYLTQSSPPIIDARLAYDLRTAFDIDKRSKPKIKQQPQWLKSTYETLANKKSNYQVSVGAGFPYEYCRIHKEPEILDYIAHTWIACKPLIDTLLGK